jgi:LPXTG-motif cell wall-anchored protein
MAPFADSCIVRRAEHTLGENWEKHVKHSSRSRSILGSVGAPWRILGAVLLALGMVLLSPTAIAGAQEGPPAETPGDEVPGDEVPEVPGDEVPGDEVPGDEVPGDEVPGDEVPEVPGDEVPGDEVPDDGTVVLEGENVRVVHTPSEVQGNCSPIPATALVNYVGSDEEAFTLTIVAEAPLCSPIEATAAIYGMPGKGEAWPQNLVETLDFTIAAAGEYVVTFTKTCDPVQFDVLTGDTPPVIAPLGEWHGPLLFPFDTNTSLQHWGCEEDAEVENITTVPTVAGVTQEPAALALTGTSSSGAAVAGGVALLAGAALLLAVRRRSA